MKISVPLSHSSSVLEHIVFPKTIISVSITESVCLLFLMTDKYLSDPAIISNILYLDRC